MEDQQHIRCAGPLCSPALGCAQGSRNSTECAGALAQQHLHLGCPAAWLVVVSDEVSGVRQAAGQVDVSYFRL